MAVKDMGYKNDGKNTGCKNTGHKNSCKKYRLQKWLQKYRSGVPVSPPYSYVNSKSIIPDILLYVP